MSNLVDPIRFPASVFTSFHLLGRSHLPDLVMGMRVIRRNLSICKMGRVRSPICSIGLLKFYLNNARYLLLNHFIVSDTFLFEAGLILFSIRNLCNAYWIKLSCWCKLFAFFRQLRFQGIFVRV